MEQIVNLRNISQGKQLIVNSWNKKIYIWKKPETKSNNKSSIGLNILII